MKYYALAGNSVSFWAVTFAGEQRRYIFAVPSWSHPQIWAPRLLDGSTGHIEIATDEEVAAYLANAGRALVVT